MAEITENFFDWDGSAKIGDVCFRPVGPEDCAKALDNNGPAILRSVDEDKFARYDAFHTGRNQFCGYLNMYYDRGGYMSFADFRKKSNGNYEVRESMLTAKMLFGIFNIPKTRSGMTKAMMEVAEELHRRNNKSSGWQEIQKNVNPQRCKFKSEGG